MKNSIEYNYNILPSGIFCGGEEIDAFGSQHETLPGDGFRGGEEVDAFGSQHETLPGDGFRSDFVAR